MSSDVTSSHFDRVLEESASRAPQDTLTVELSEDEIAVLEGWRQAHNFPSTAEAVRALVRIALLSELSESQRVLKSIRDAIDR